MRRQEGYPRPRHGLGEDARSPICTPPSGQIVDTGSVIGVDRRKNRHFLIATGCVTALSERLGGEYRPRWGGAPPPTITFVLPNSSQRHRQACHDRMHGHGNARGASSAALKRSNAVGVEPFTNAFDLVVATWAP